MRRPRLARVLGTLGHRLLVLMFVVFAAFPFYWTLITTFKQNRDLYVGATDVAHDPLIFNARPTLAHLDYLFARTLFPTWLANTLWVGALVVVITLALAVPAGYALARLTGRWGERLGISVFLVYLVPPALLFIPFSRLVALLGLQDSLWALVVVYPTFTVPFCAWLLMGFFRSLPLEIEESARVDGCGRLGAAWRVVLPLAVPGLLTVVIFSLTLVVQEFVYGLTFLSSVGRMTVSVGVPVALVRGDVYYWGSLMAACLLTSLPIALLYDVFLDRFIAGFTAGALH